MVAAAAAAVVVTGLMNDVSSSTGRWAVRVSSLVVMGPSLKVAKL